MDVVVFRNPHQQQLFSAKFRIYYIPVDSQNLPQPFIQTKNDTLRGWRKKTVEQFSCHTGAH